MRFVVGFILACIVMASHAAAEEATWSVRVTPYNGIYPSLELSQARRKESIAAAAHVVGGGSGLIAVSLRSQHADERVSVSLRIPSFDRPERFATTLDDAGVDYELHPPLDWNVPQLRSLSSPQSTHVTFALMRDGRDAGMREVAVTLHPLGEALYFVRDGKDTVDLSWIFAAYVNENDAVVDTILDDAISSGIVDGFDSDNVRDADGILREVWAVWHALNARGIRYSSADPAIERGPHVFSQRVRFLGDTWSDRSANCIDGSVLIASVLQRIGVRSFLVLVPGHAFVGFYTDNDAEHAAYLETTLLGATIPQAAHLPTFGSDVANTSMLRRSLNSFAAALAAGRAHHARVAAKLDGRHRPDYQLIDIPAARAFGIRPLDETATR
jgi:hypothetical protein